MNSTAATAHVKIAHEELLDSFAAVVHEFCSTPNDEVLARVPALLVSEFQAARAELWLWDRNSNSARLTHFAGQDAERTGHSVSPGSGALGMVADSCEPAVNLVLRGSAGEDQDFSRRSGLTHMSAYPLLTEGNRLVGILAGYSEGALSADSLSVWQTYSELCAIRLVDGPAAQSRQKEILQLSLLFEATRLLNSTLDLAELLELILRIARQEVHADRGSVFLVDAARKQLWSIVAQGLNHEEIRVPFGHGVAGRVAETGEIVNVEDAYKLEFFEQAFDRKFNYRTSSLLCMPIRHRSGEIVGVIELLNKTTGRKFADEDVEFLTKLSGHMALALENAKLHRDALEKQRMEKELALARGIQQSLLPDAPPVLHGFEFAVANEPCFEVGGDYYDFLKLDLQSLLLVVADVEGKGVSSALVMSNLQAALRALVIHLHSLEVLMKSLNEMMYNDTKSHKSLSCFLGLVDIRHNGLHYINAGHVPPLLIAADGSYRLLEEGGTLVGIFPQTEYRRGSLTLSPGDILVCCTDGILEACDATDEEYGTERLVAAIVRRREMHAQDMVDSVLEEVNLWCSDVHGDDKVLMIMKVKQDGARDSAQSGFPRPSSLHQE